MTVLVRVLQRKRNDRIYIYKEIYYGEIAIVIMEAEKPAVNWRLRRARGIVWV